MRARDEIPLPGGKPPDDALRTVAARSIHLVEMDFAASDSKIGQELMKGGAF
jgi:hypothetical protein